LSGRKSFGEQSNIFAIKNIPILIFIDKNVYSEFQTYKGNQDFFDNIYSDKETLRKSKFKFAHVDHINVFRFIDLIRTKPVKTFEKVEEIENYIKSQLSGMFYLYLESLKQISDDKKILDTVTELNNITLRMDTMLNSVGKQILGKDKKEYEIVIENQFRILLDFFMEKFAENFDFNGTLDDDVLLTISFDTISEIIYDKVLTSAIPLISSDLKETEWRKAYSLYNTQFISDIQRDISNVSNELVIAKLNFRTLNEDFQKKVLPFVKGPEDVKKIITRISSYIKNSMEDLPF